MSSLIDIKTSTNRLLFDLRDVTFMVYHENSLIIHHINEPAISAYRVDNLSEEKLYDLVDNMKEILLYNPPPALEPDRRIMLFFASHIKNIITTYSTRSRRPDSIRIDYPNTYVGLVDTNDVFYNNLWSAMKISESHAMT